MSDLTEVIKSFNKDVQLAYDVPRQRNYISLPLLQKINEYEGDGVRVARYFLGQEKDAYYDALYKLKGLNLLDYSIEALALNSDKGYPQLFEKEELETAHRRLKVVAPDYRAPGNTH